MHDDNPNKFRIIASVKLLICNTLKRRGIDPAPLCKVAGVALPDLLHPMKRDKTSKVAHLINLAAEITNNPSFVLEIARHVNLMSFASYGAAIIASPTLGEALILSHKYSKLLTDSGTFEIISSRSRVSSRLILLEKDKTYLYENLSLLYLAGLLQVGRRLGTPTMIPLQVRLEQAEPKNIVPFRNFFGCPVYFGQTMNSISISKEYLDIPVAAHDPRYSQLAKELAAEDLKILNTCSVAEEVCVLIENTLAEGEPKISAVAATMGLNPRSLQRKLAAEKHTFARLLDNTRKRMAYQKILKPSEQIKTLAYDLGFSDQSNFNRAFKRWYSLSPTEYRRKISHD